MKASFAWLRTALTPTADMVSPSGQTLGSPYCSPRRALFFRPDRGRMRDRFCPGEMFMRILAIASVLLVLCSCGGGGGGGSGASRPIGGGGGSPGGGVPIGGGGPGTPAIASVNP